MGLGNNISGGGIMCLDTSTSCDYSDYNIELAYCSGELSLIFSTLSIIFI